MRDAKREFERASNPDHVYTYKTNKIAFNVKRLMPWIYCIIENRFSYASHLRDMYVHMLLNTCHLAHNVHINRVIAAFGWQKRREKKLVITCDHFVLELLIKECFCVIISLLNGLNSSYSKVCPVLYIL